MSHYQTWKGSHLVARRVANAVAFFGVAVLGQRPLPGQTLSQRLMSSPGYAVAYSDTTLANGLRLLVVEQDFAPVVSIAMMLRLGSREDPAGRAGMAHLLEHLAGDPGLAGHRRQGGWAPGGSLPGFTGFNATGYTARTPKANLGAALFDFADLLRNEHLAESGLEVGVRGVLAEHAQGVLNQAYGLSGLCAWEAYWRGVRACRTGVDIEREVRAASLNELQQLFHQRYRPDNAVLVVVGDVNRSALVRTVASLFGGPAVSPMPARLTAAPASARPEIHLSLSDRLARATRVDLAYRTVAGDAPEFTALVVLHEILLGNRAALLSNQLVEKSRLATRVESPGFAFPGPALPASFGIGVVLAPSALPDTLEQAVREAIGRIVEANLTASVVELAKSRVARDFVEATRARGPDGLAYALASLATDDKPARINSWLTELDAVSPTDVAAAARRFLSAPAQIVVTTTPVAITPPSRD